MKFKILCGNTIDGLGSRIAKSVKHFEFETSYCTNSFNTLWQKLSEEHYDGLIFFCIRDFGKVIEFVQECHLKYPALKIYPITTWNDNLNSELKKAGASHCISVPYNEYSICADLVNDFHSADELPILPEIAEYLFNKGFPNHLIGFYFLSCIIEKAIESPYDLENAIMNLYDVTGRIMNAKNQHVERSIRIVSAAGFRNGIVINGEVSFTRLKNKELITVLTKEYATEFGLWDV